MTNLSIKGQKINRYDIPVQTAVIFAFIIFLII